MLHTLRPGHSAQLAGFLQASAGAILFSAKAVLAKLIYREVAMPVSDLLAFRMLFSLPFFATIFLIEHRKRTQTADGIPVGRPGKMLYLKTIGVGLLGYYISSFLDFSGLRFISAGLERIVLFSYPTMVLLFAAVMYGVAIRKYQWLALLLCYAGIALSFAADMRQGSPGDVITGGLLILGCALTYAFYVLWSGRLIPVMGSAYFTSIAMMAATAAVLLHYWANGSELEVVMHFSAKVYSYLLLMAIFSTVVPTLLISAALRRLGSGNVAIVSAIGPVATIVLGSVFLGEPVGVYQVAGAVLVIAGVLIIGKKQTQTNKIDA